MVPAVTAFIPNSGRTHAALHEAVIDPLPTVTSLCRTSYSDRLNPSEVRFQHQEQARKKDYSLFRCPVLFSSEKSALVSASAHVNHPLPAPNRELARANDQILSAFLAKLLGDDRVTRVKTVIANELPSGSPSKEFIAQAVYMSPRGLRRLLSTTGTTHSKLLDAVRQELAEQYLANPAQPLKEIAFLLGFSELSAFPSAFMRLTGQSPSTFRNAL